MSLLSWWYKDSFHDFLFRVLDPRWSCPNQYLLAYQHSVLTHGMLTHTIHMLHGLWSMPPAWQAIGSVHRTQYVSVQVKHRTMGHASHIMCKINLSHMGNYSNMSLINPLLCLFFQELLKKQSCFCLEGIAWTHEQLKSSPWVLLSLGLITNGYFFI